MYKEQTKLKNVEIKDLFPGYPSKIKQVILIYKKNLMIYRQGLINETNRQRREGTLFSVWTMDGKIFVKTSPDGTPIQVFSEEDLDNLLEIQIIPS